MVMRSPEDRRSGDTGILVGLSVIACVVGLLLLSNATAGVGVLALALLLAVFARIVQAGHQHRELKAMLSSRVSSTDSIPDQQ